MSFELVRWLTIAARIANRPLMVVVDGTRFLILQSDHDVCIYPVSIFATIAKTNDVQRNRRKQFQFWSFLYALLHIWASAQVWLSLPQPFRAVNLDGNHVFNARKPRDRSDQNRKATAIPQTTRAYHVSGKRGRGKGAVMQCTIRTRMNLHRRVLAPICGNRKQRNPHVPFRLDAALFLAPAWQVRRKPRQHGTKSFLSGRCPQERQGHQWHRHPPSQPSGNEEWSIARAPIRIDGAFKRRDIHLVLLIHRDQAQSVKPRPDKSIACAMQP